MASPPLYRRPLPGGKQTLPSYSESNDDEPVRTPRRRQHKGRLVAILALTAVAFLYTRDSPHLASGLAQCDYIRTAPGPSPGFSTRKVSDRYEKGTLPVILRNATIWTGNEEGREAVKGDIHLDGGIIVAVGKVHSVKGVEEVDIQGAWVTPGIVDGHSHGGLDGANSVAGNIHPYIRSLDVFDTSASDLKLIVAGGVTTSLLLPGSAVGIGGQAYPAKFRPTSSNAASSWLVEPAFDFDVNGNMTARRIPSHWRHMKHALGENPDSVFGIVRMDNIWDMRKAYAAAKEWKVKQDEWCASASSWFKDVGPFPTAPLEHEALVDVLNGKVKLNVHSYEVTDFDALVRMSNEFEFSVAGIHHAHEAWIVPDLLKRMYKSPPAVAIFASFSMYKKESMRSSRHAPKILSDAGLSVVMKSDHNGVVARWLAQEASLAHHWGLDEATAMSAITTHPARMLGLDHRVGYIRPGYDADVVVWQSHPLAQGAVPAQVYIDGIPQLESPVIKPGLRVAPPAGDFTEEIARDIASKGNFDYTPRHVFSDVTFTNVSSVIIRQDGALLSQDGPNVRITNGEISCIGDCALTSHTIDLRGGSLSPGLIVSGGEIGIYDIDLDTNGPAPGKTDPITSTLPKLVSDSIQRASDGISFGTTKFWRFIQSGVSFSITAPRATGVVGGLSTFIRLGAKHSLDEGIIVDQVALHVAIASQGEGGEYPSMSTQIGTLRDLLEQEQNTDLGRAFARAASGKIPLVVNVNKADHIASLLRLKNGFPSLRLVIHGAAEAHLLADELAAAKVGVIVSPYRSFPYSADQTRSLPGLPLTRETAISTLYKAGVIVGIGIDTQTPPFQSALFTARWHVANIISDTASDIPYLDALAMFTTNLIELYGLSGDEEVRRVVQRDSIAYEGGDMSSLGGSKVVAFATKGGVAVF